MKTYPADDPRLTFFNQNEPPKSGMTVFVDHWWAAHPEKGLAVWERSHPQCSTSEALVRILIAGLYPWAEVKFVPIAHVQIDQS